MIRHVVDGAVFALAVLNAVHADENLIAVL
jgi:hypothetical protein